MTREHETTGRFALEADVPSTPAAAFEALTQPEIMRAVAAIEVEAEGKLGGLVEWRFMEAGNASRFGCFELFEPPRRFAIAWDAPRGDRLGVELHERDGGTRIAVSVEDLEGGRLSQEEAARLGRQLDRVRDFLDGTVRAEREVLAPRASIEHALVELPPAPGLISCEDRGPRTLVRLVRTNVFSGTADLHPAERADLYEMAAGEARFRLLELAARVAGATLEAEVEVARIGPRRNAEALEVEAPLDRVFAMIAGGETERARWGPLGDGRRIGSVAAGASSQPALDEVWFHEHPRSVTALRFEIAPLGPARTLVRFSEEGFLEDRDGALEQRIYGLGWSLYLANLRAVLSAGLDLRPLSRTLCLYPEEIEAEERIPAPPAGVAARLAGGAKKRGEMLVSASASRVETVRRLERAEEVSFITYHLAREGIGTLVRAVQRGFTVDEELWPIADRLRLIPAMALSRGEEEVRLAELLRHLAGALGREPSLRREVALRCGPAEAFAALTGPRELEVWHGPGATMEAWPGGRFRLGPRGALSGDVLEAEPGRRLVLAVDQGATLVAIDLVETTTGTRVELAVSGSLPARRLPGQEDLLAEEVAALEAYVEGRVERSFDVAMPVARAFELVHAPERLRGWLDPDASLVAGAEAAVLIEVAPGLGRERCRVLACDEPRRFELEWPCAGRGASGEGRPSTLSVVLVSAGSERTRATLSIRGIPSGFEKPEVYRRERARVDFLARSLAGELAGRGGLARAAAGWPFLGEGRLECAVEVAAAQDRVFEAVREKVERVFGSFLEETPPSRVVAAAAAAPGEPEGVTIVTVEVEDLGENRSLVRALEEGFREGPEWDDRLATEERGFAGFFEELKRL